MKNIISLVALSMIGLLLASVAIAQEPEPESAKGMEERAQEALSATKEQVSEIAAQVDKSAKAQKLTAGLLEPIYTLAERLAFPAFHWVAFAIMVAGVVSFALQLVIAKLLVLSKLGLSATEILSDALGLVISLVGLVLTTQAATENSDFTRSSFAVLSSAGLGIVIGFVFYLWGQAQELQAVRGRKNAGSKAGRA